MNSTTPDPAPHDEPPSLVLGGNCSFIHDEQLCRGTILAAQGSRVQVQFAIDGVTVARWIHTDELLDDWQ